MALVRKKYTKGEITLSELIVNSVICSNGCHEWTGSVARNGYGQVRRNKKLITVTRLIAHFVFGMDLTDKRFVLHHCDNPKCINPQHLYIGTAIDNVRDKVKRDRHNRGRRVWKAKLKDSDIPMIFALHKKGWAGNAIAKRYKISRSSIYQILQRKAWKHVKVETTINRAKCAETKENLC